MLVSATPHNLVVKFIIDIQGRISYPPCPKKEVLIKIKKNGSTCRPVG